MPFQGEAAMTLFVTNIKIIYRNIAFIFVNRPDSFNGLCTAISRRVNIDHLLPLLTLFVRSFIVNSINRSTIRGMYEKADGIKMFSRYPQATR